MMFLVGFSMLAGSALAQRATEVAPTVRCESKDGHYHECRWGGFGTVLLTRTMSKAECVRGKSWDYTDRVIWVDRGCRAEFGVQGTEKNLDKRMQTVTVAKPATIPVGARTFTCESMNNARQTCAADTTYGVYISRQLGTSDCAYNRDWGYDANGVWVSNGCRAEFTTGDAFGNLGSMPQARYSSIVLCESQNGKRHTCNADTRFGVDVFRQLSKADCVYGDSWGYDNRGIWVDKGCRAEFALDRTAQ